MAKARQVAQAVFNTVQGRRDQVAARTLEDAIQYTDYELRAEKVKSRAGLALMLIGVAAPAYAAGAGTMMSVGGASTEAITAIGVVFGAGTSTIEGGPLEGIKQGIAMTGLPGMVASEMLTGYQRGGLLSSGGVVGALERGAETLMAGKLVESMAGKAGAWYASKAKSGVLPPVPVTETGTHGCADDGVPDLPGGQAQITGAGEGIPLPHWGDCRSRCGPAQPGSQNWRFSARRRLWS